VDIDPYQVPASNLGKQTTLKYSLMWKMYFFFITFLSIIAFISLYYDKNFGTVEVISIVLSLPATIGLFGYIFRKKILTPNIWNIFFFIYLFWSILYDFISEIDQSAGMSNNVYIISMTIGWLISIPAFLALFYYGRESCSVWQKTSSENSR